METRGPEVEDAVQPVVCGILFRIVFCRRTPTPITITNENDTNGIRHDMFNEGGESDKRCELISRVGCRPRQEYPHNRPLIHARGFNFNFPAVVFHNIFTDEEPYARTRNRLLAFFAEK